MCTYNLTFNDSLVESAKRSFPTQTAITEWMQQQMERMLRQIAVPEPSKTSTVRKVEVSDRIKSLSAVPPCSDNKDYKEDFESVLTEKY